MKRRACKRLLTAAVPFSMRDGPCQRRPAGVPVQIDGKPIA